MKTKLTRQQLALIAVLLIAFALLKGGLIWWYLHYKNQPEAPITVSCPNLQAGCQLPDGSLLRLDRVPQAATPFGLTLSQLDGKPPAIAFSMRDMDMGFNRYRFVDGGDHWQARVTLPACVSGSPDWLLDLHQDGHIYRIAFRAD